MTNGEILQAAIQKANSNRSDGKRWTVGLINFIEPEKYYDLIFSHSFAKAFWGETEAILAWYAEGMDERPYSLEKGFTWQIHLMRMVLEEDPIQYLVKFL